jgi:hypothetical protein
MSSLIMVIANQGSVLKHSVSGQPSQEEIKMAKCEKGETVLMERFQQAMCFASISCSCKNMFSCVQECVKITDEGET